jgi:hypothetical protein
MLCCSQEALGIARFPKDVVIEACEGTLRSIEATHEKLRNDFIESELESQIWWWKHLWRWVTIGLAPKPTMKSAIYEYMHGNRPVPMKFQVDMTHGRQQQICKKVLAAARSSNGNSIYLTPEAASTCNVAEAALTCNVETK